MCITVKVWGLFWNENTVKAAVQWLSASYLILEKVEKLKSHLSLNQFVDLVEITN